MNSIYEEYIQKAVKIELSLQILKNYEMQRKRITTYRQLFIHCNYFKRQNVSILLQYNFFLE